MTLILKGSTPLALTFFPKTRADQVIQELYILINSMRGEVPTYRDFGVNPSWLHMPYQVAATSYSVSIREAIKKYLPEVSIEDLTFESDPDNPTTLYPVLEVTVDE